jgi:hypothetical protein
MYHVPDGHMTEFPTDYIKQGWAKHLETHRKFVDFYRFLDMFIWNLYGVRNLYGIRWWILVHVNMCLMMYIMYLMNWFDQFVSM